MQQSLPTIENYRNIITQNRPLIDVRAPIEYTKGAFPNSINLPLMNDQERHLVGTCYKKSGNIKATELGHSLVSGKIKRDRVDAWLEQIKNEPDSHIYCFRGGQRSQISQQWIADAGVNIARLKGGYKEFRSYLIEQIDNITTDKQIFVLGGHTGSGKTMLLKKIKQSIDLEGTANHRGSSFGRHASAQPSQIDFENALAYALVMHDEERHDKLIVEDESRNIGRCYIPPVLFAQFTQAPVILLETSLDERIEITYDEYVIASQIQYDQAHQAGTTEHPWIDTMRHNFARIKKRLGDQGYQSMSRLLEEAWSHQLSTNDAAMHKIWIKELLEKYYDPMYGYQIEQKRDRVIFSGREEAILEYLQNSPK